MLAPKIVILKGETHHNVSLSAVDFVFQALIDKKPQNIKANLLVNCHFWADYNDDRSRNIRKKIQL